MKAHRGQQKDRRVAHAIGVATTVISDDTELEQSWRLAGGIPFERFRGFRAVRVRIGEVYRQLERRRTY